MRFHQGFPLAVLGFLARLRPRLSLNNRPSLTPEAQAAAQVTVGQTLRGNDMAWNWGEAKARKLIRRKPVACGDGENTKEVQELANRFICQGYTRQRAYAKARAQLKQQYRKTDAKILSGVGRRVKMKKAAYILSLFAATATFAQYGTDRVEQDREDRGHPIDIKYEGKLDFMGTNREMEVAIVAARDDWMEVIEKKKAILVKSLPTQQKKLFLEAQSKWEEAYAADMKFFFSDSQQILVAVGREGEIISKMEFMNRVRKRALDLTEYVDIFVDSKNWPIKSGDDNSE
jgi:hypothetical protein